MLEEAEFLAIQSSLEKLISEYPNAHQISNIDDFEVDGTLYKFLPFSFKSFDDYKEWEEGKVANDEAIYVSNFYISEDSFDTENKQLFFIVWLAIPQEEYNKIFQPVPELFTQEDVEKSAKHDRSWWVWLKKKLSFLQYYQ